MTGFEFKDLQKYWYDRLADSGFVDIEYNAERKAGSMWAPKVKEDLEASNYYRAVSHAYEQVFGALHPRLLSNRQRVLMHAISRHADGASYRQISSELAASGLRPCRVSTVFDWVRHFVHACGIRTVYEDK